MNLQAAGTESVVWERKTAAAAGRSGFAALATATVARGARGEGGGVPAPALGLRRPERLLGDAGSSGREAGRARTPRRRGGQHPRRRGAPGRSRCAHRGARNPEASNGSRDRAKRWRRAFRGDPLHRARDVGPASAAQGARSGRRRGSARRFPEATRRRLRRAVAAAPARDAAGAGHPRRSARRASAEVHRQERAPAPADLLPSRRLGTPGRHAVRGGTAHRRPGRHRAADRRLRIDAADREGVLAGAGVRLRPRRRDRGPDDPPRAGDRARDGAR